MLKLTNVFLALPDYCRRALAVFGIGRNVLSLRDKLYFSEELQRFSPAARELRIRYMVRSFMAGRPLGSHIAGFYPFMAENHTWKHFPDLQYKNNDVPSETIFDVIDQNDIACPPRGVATALHIHAYYIDGLLDIKKRILLNEVLPDLYFTGPETNRYLVEEIFSDYPRKFFFQACENYGRDIGPFLETLKTIPNCYDLIGHVHTKRSLGSSSTNFATAWLNFLLSSNLGNCAENCASTDRIVCDFARREIKPAIYIPHVADDLGWEANFEIASDLAVNFELEELPQKIIFPAGSMFWASSAYLSDFKNLELNWKELAPEPLKRDGTVLHAIERMFGAVALARGEVVIIVPPPRAPFVFSEKVMHLCAAEDN
jgi:lipopolysaccharide biosynthesis protein